MKQSARPRDARFRAVEKQGVKFENFADSGDFDALDAKLATALTNALRHDDLKRLVTKVVPAVQLKDEIAKGRQSLPMITGWYRVVEAGGCF